MSRHFTFAVVDDHPMVRRGIVEILLDQSDFRVLGEGGCADDALQLAAEHNPNMMLLDVNMPGCGVAAAGLIRASYPQVRTTLFSFRQDLEVVRASFEAGASGYIVKGISSVALIAAVRTMLAGETYLSQALRERLNGDS